MVKKLYEQEHNIDRNDWVELGGPKKTVGSAIASANLFRKGLGASNT